MKNRKMLVSGTTLLLVVASSAVHGDVTMQQRVEVDAGGFMSMFAMSGTWTTYLSKDRSRTESAMESKSGFMGSLMGDLDSHSIVRLDRDLTWQLMPKKKKYSEMTLEQMRAQMQKSVEQLEQMQQSGGGSGALPVSEENCQWSDPTMDVRETGEKQRFANVKAEQHIITIRETCTVPESGQTCVVTWTMENWMANRMPGEDETRAFHTALAEKLGVGNLASGTPAASSGLLAMFKEGWEEALDEAGDLRGYPVKTVMQLEMGGDSCTAMSGQPIAKDDIWSNAADAGVNAGAQTAGSHASSAIGQATADAMGDSVGGSVAGSAVGAASNEVIGGLLNRFRNRKKKNEPPPEPAATSPAAQSIATSGSAVLFRISSELTSISEDRIPAAQFEVPAGWKRID